MRFYTFDKSGKNYDTWMAVYFKHQAQFKKYPPDNEYAILLRKDQYKRECEEMYKAEFNKLFAIGFNLTDIRYSIEYTV
jgi:hypothetical protein